MKKKPYIFFFLTALSLCAFFADRYLYMNRFDGYLYTEALNNNDFYNINEKYRIKGFDKKDSNLLTVKIFPFTEKNTWVILDSTECHKQENTFPVLKLKRGVHSYSFYNKALAYLDTVKLEIEFDKGGGIFVMLSNLPMIDTDLIPLNKWTALPQSISQQEIQEVKKIIKDSVNILPEDITTVRITKLASFLLKKLEPHLGAPCDSIKQLTPLKQFKMATGNASQIDCANYADIYFLFANCAGIPTRRIGTAGQLGNVTTSGHVFNESYVKEQQRWAFVDLTSEKIMVVNAHNKVLNSVELLRANAAGLTFGLRTITLKKDKLVFLDYETTNTSEIEYLKPTVALYSIKNDINNNMPFIDSFKEFLSKSSHYGVYYSNTITVDNSKHYFKMYVFYTSVIIWSLWLVLLAVNILRFLIRLSFTSIARAQ